MLRKHLSREEITYKLRVSERRACQILKQPCSTQRLITIDSGHVHPRNSNEIREPEPLSLNHNWIADITYLRYGR